MEAKNTFFIQWKNYIKNSNYINIKGSHVYKEKQFHLLKEENIKWWNKPYFAILNENEIVKNFINAIKSNEYEEAKIYISKNITVNLDEVGKLFERSTKYKYSLNYYFNESIQKGVSKVTIAAKAHEAMKYTDIIHVQMIDEPDMYGKWKIYKIEKE